MLNSLNRDGRFRIRFRYPDSAIEQLDLAEKRLSALEREQRKQMFGLIRASAASDPTPSPDRQKQCMSHVTVLTGPERLTFV